MNKNKEVDAWLQKYDNPMKAVVVRVREIVLAADKRIEECIKWQAPTFTYNGNLASFMPRSKKHANLMFHTGAKIPGKHPRLEGSGSTARFMTFVDLAEANARKKDLERVVAAWCTAQGSAANKPAAKSKKRTAAKKKASKKKAAKTKAAKKATPKKASKKKPEKK